VRQCAAGDGPIVAIDGRAWDYEVDPSLPYASDTGVAAFLGTRRTDGGRPARYAAFIAAHEQQCDAVIGLGCGDSEVEAAVCAALDPPPAACFGIDVARDAAALSEPRFAGAATRFHFLHGDWAEPALQARLAERLGRASRLTLMVGRTFGNGDSADLLATLRPLAGGGTLYLDGFASLDASDEARFAARMAQVAQSAATFMTAPLVERGLLAPGQPLTPSIADERHALRCDFLVRGTPPEGERAAHYRLFSIRMFRVDALTRLAAAQGYSVTARLDLPDQILPMTLLRLEAPV
jgi:hypothetical protein